MTELGYNLFIDELEYLLILINGEVLELAEHIIH